MDPGEFREVKNDLKKIIEKEWKGKKYRVKVRWLEKNPTAYKFVAHSDSSKSITNHTQKTIYVANYSPEKTIAHEVGHVLGFEDHYYDVWHEKNCYYTQEFRIADIMSDSSAGSVMDQHWVVLDKAYPFKKAALNTPFSYVFKD